MFKSLIAKIKEAVEIQETRRMLPYTMAFRTTEFMGFGKGLRQELEADEWAFKQGGDMTPVLKNFLKDHSTIAIHAR